MEDLFQIGHDPYQQSARLHDLLSSNNGAYVLVLGSTETSDIEGISAAGANGGARRLTPSIDADLLLLGRPREGEAVPVSPKGVVSPVVISRACLKAMGMTPKIVDCGTFRAPVRSDLTAGRQPAKCVSTGYAMPYENVVDLFEEGRRFARTMTDEKYIILSECVPGGTTTALALLEALGVDANALVSSSLPGFNDHRQCLVDDGLKKAGLQLEDDGSGAEVDLLQILAAIGDPMQPFIAGATLEASKSMPVILGGGSQMLAIYHLCERLSKSPTAVSWNNANVFVVTTKWIIRDAYSDTQRLSEIIGAPFFASLPDFSLSRFAGLRAYEQGHVKEGVGAGALMLAAQLSKSFSSSMLMEVIDECYEELVVGC